MATSALSCSCGLLLTLLLVVSAASEGPAHVTPTLIECHPATTKDSSANANVASLLGALPSAAAPTRFASLRSAGPDRAFARGICFRCFNRAQVWKRSEVGTNDSRANATAFRANVASLLGSLPSAAASTRFASLWSAGPDRAFARGICFRDAAPPDYLACLSVAAKNLTDGCGAATWRARVSTGGCSVSYADTDVSATSYGAFRARVVSGPLASTSKSDVHKMLAPADATAAPVPTKSKTIWMKMKGDPILLAVFIVAGLSLVPLLAFFICVLLFGCC